MRSETITNNPARASWVARLRGLAGIPPAKRGAYHDRTLNFLRFAVAVSAIALLAVAAYFISDSRRIPDTVGLLVLAISLIGIIVTFVTTLTVRIGGARAWLIISGAVVSLTAIGFTWFSIAIESFTTSLIVFSQPLLIVAIGLGLIWLLITLVRRRGRAVAAALLISSGALMAFQVVGLAILTVPERLTETREEISLSSVFPPASGWSTQDLDAAFGYAQDLGSSSVIVVSRRQPGLRSGAIQTSASAVTRCARA